MSSSFWLPMCSLACRCSALITASVITRFSWCYLSSPPYGDSIWSKFSAHPLPIGPHLNQLQLQWPYFQITSHSEVLDVRTSIRLSGGHNNNSQDIFICCKSLSQLAICLLSYLRSLGQIQVVYVV